MSELALKLAALFSFCGGPLFVSDLLKPRVGTPAAFWITFAPVGLMLVGALHLGYLPGDRWARAAVSLGRQSVYVVLGMHAYTLARFASGTRVVEPWLYLFGITVGVIWSLAYLRAARQLEAKHLAMQQDRSSAEPIEPS